MHLCLYDLIRDHFKDMQGYVSAGMEATKDSSKIFLNANENPYELPGLEGYNRYPQPQPAELLNAYAELYSVQPQQIAMTRGADEAISLLTKLFCEPDQDKILINPPTFGMYRVNADAMPADIVSSPLIRAENTFFLNVDSIIKIARDPSQNIKLVFLCSPNNPTGTSFERDDIRRICKSLEGEAIVILDETYSEFSTKESFTTELEQLPNLIILRTLSKSYSLAGMRMGSILCADENFIALVRSKAMDAYPLPKESIGAALKVTASEIQSQAKANIEILIDQRKRMELALSELPIIKTIFDSDANFLLIEMERAHEFILYCAENNVVIRDFSDKPLTENCIRLSIGTLEENDRVLALFNQFI